MKRIGIFQCYDENGIIDDYIFYLLKTIRTVLDDLIIVSNGSIEESYQKELYRYASRIYFRNDVGFDSGAFQDIFLEFCKDENWKAYDEIVLMNDTFFGPLFSWKIIFDSMEEKKVDFWGLDETKRTLETGELLSYIIPYFLVVRKDIIETPSFLQFWREMECPEVYGMDVGMYWFTRFFLDRGFHCTTWLRECGGEDIIAPNVAHYLKYPYRLISTYRFPIVKYKLFSIFRYEESKRVMDFVKHHTNYDIALIKNHIDRLMNSGQMVSYSDSDLEAFVRKYSKIYIVGHGLYASGLTAYFMERNWVIQGYLVSEVKKEKEISLQEYVPQPQDGVIVAVGFKNFIQIKETLHSIPSGQLLMYRHRSLPN